MKSAIIPLIVLAVVPTAAHASPLAPNANDCSQEAVATTAAQVESARKDLLKLPIGDGLETDVSQAAQEEIKSLKDALGGFIDAYMGCVSAQPVPAQIEKDLSKRVHAFRLPPGPMSKDQIPPDFGKYGFELWFGAKTTSEQRLVAVTAGFSIECGSDTMLLIFAPDGDSWKEVLRWQSEPYKTVAAAFEAFDYGISPPDESGHWYVVAHNIMAWCSSTWSSIRYAVLRPTSDPLKPAVLMSRSDGMWWGNEDFGSLVVWRNDFDLRFHSNSIDSGVHNRVWIRHYTITDDMVKRVQPVAVSPRDFVDEWIISSWRDASAWSSPRSLDQLRQMHGTLHRLNHHFGFEFDSVQKCSGTPSTVQVEVVQIKDGGDSGDTFFFRVVGDGPFQMKAVSCSPDSKCSGANILDTIATQ